MKKDNTGLGSVLSEAGIILVGEVVVSLITALVYILIQQFDYTVVLGLLLGSTVTVANFLILGITVNNAVNKALARRPEGEMTEEEAAAFAAENQASVQLAAAGTYVLRTLLMLGALIGAFMLDGIFGVRVFDVIATLVPLMMYRPIIFVSELIRKKKGGVAS